MLFDFGEKGDKELREGSLFAIPVGRFLQ